MHYFLLLALLAADAPRPNIIVFNVDDMGYADVGCFGSKLNRTPNVDRLAAEGMKLTCFYAAPVCSPSRAALMTGCYPKRVGIPQVLFPGNASGLNADETTLAELLKAQGYATICIGKWHLGDQPEFLPTRHGFDHYFGLPYSNDMGPAEDGARAGIGQPKAKNLDAKQKRRGHPPLPLLRDEKVVERVYAKEQASLTRRYTEEAVKFIREQAAGAEKPPFFLYLPHTAVHVPLYPGEEFKGKSPHGIYSDWVEEVDWSLGQVVDAARTAGIAERTLVIFTSDNGGTPRAVNAPLRGFKGSTLEGGMREPTVVWWPGKIAAGSTCDAVTSNMDLVPTLTKLAGGSLPADRQIDGHDIWPLLSGQTKESPYEAFYYFQANRLNAVRSGLWKLELASGKLYNLETDIGEATDVAAANPAVVERLQALAETAKADLGGEGIGPGCRPPGRVQDARPIIDHDGKVREEFLAGTKLGPGVSQENAARETPGPGLVPAKNKPNIVFVLVDDMGYADLGCTGAKDIQTPHIDRLAAEGLKFTDFYANASVCTPTRAAFITGRWQQRVGFEWAMGFTAEQARRVNGQWVNEPDIHALGLPPGKPTIATRLKEAGYATGAFGKWHLGYKDEYNPTRHGFDEYFGVLLGHADYYRYNYFDGTYELRDGLNPVKAEGYLTDLLNQRAAQFVAKHAKEPFFLYVPYNAVHSPYQPPNRPLPAVTKEGMYDGNRQIYAAMLEKVDEGVGMILAELEKQGLADNTLFVLSSDNGGERYSDNAPLFHHKQTLWEGGIRVPCLMRWPAKLPRDKLATQPAITMDLTATFLAAAGVSASAEPPLDGINLLPILLGEAPPQTRTFCWRVNRSNRQMKAVRHGDWKYVQDAGVEMLFNLKDDIGERRDMAFRHPEILADLKSRLQAWEAEMDASPREFIVH